VTIFLACLSGAALIVSAASALYSRRAVKAADRSAAAADRSATAIESGDRRERTPRLPIFAHDPAPAPCDRVIYRLRNDGPQDLSSVTIYRPRSPDQIEYRLAKTGDGEGWAEDEITYGPLAMTQELRFTLSCGVAETLPEFRVRIEAKSGNDTWKLSEPLPTPRTPKGYFG
jgi:hypothetical protein